VWGEGPLTNVSFSTEEVRIIDPARIEYESVRVELVEMRADSWSSTGSGRTGGCSSAMRVAALGGFMAFDRPNGIAILTGAGSIDDAFILPEGGCLS
jgi:hypothetical protein